MYKPRTLPRPALTLLLLPMLLAGCASCWRAPPPPVAPPEIPPLPATARQPEQSQTHSARALSDIEAWLQTLTQPDLQGSPANGATTR